MKKSVIGVLVLCLLPMGVLAQETSEESVEECTQPQELDRYRLLRRLSLDLRQQLPSYQEFSALDGETELPESMVDDLMTSPEFARAMRSFHEGLLWPNPNGADLLDNNTRLATEKGGGPSSDIYFVISASRRAVYRNDAGTKCGNYEQTEFTPNGAPIPEVTGETGSTGKPIFQEGWVWVSPYWDPDNPIKVCAFDAQEAVDGVKAGTRCDKLTLHNVTKNPAFDSGCGCGPNLRWCYGPTVEAALWDDMREQFGRLIDDVSTGALPYTDIIQSQRIYMNGRLDYWKKHMANLAALNRTINYHAVGDPDLLEEPDYMDETWRVAERSDIHAGVQTLPAYLLRFQTNRSRANRFRIAFTGQYFVPPEQPEDAAESDCLEETGDVTQQCTCRYCHQVLEPLALYWGQVLDSGTILLSDLETYESLCDPLEYMEGGAYYNPNASDDKSPLPIGCGRFYEISVDGKNPGWLLTHQFIYLEEGNHNNDGMDDALHQAMGENLAEGPMGYADQIISSGQFANAVVRNIFVYLMGRDMILDPSQGDNEIELLSELSKGFQSDMELEDGTTQAYHFPSLVKTLVQLPQYRRVR